MSVITRTIQYYREKEATAFRSIPGMIELLQADDRSFDSVAEKYPDAAFAFRVSNNLLCGDREQSAMNQRAYLALLDGESVENVRFRFDGDMKRYVEQHMWDD